MDEEKAHNPSEQEIEHKDLEEPIVFEALDTGIKATKEEARLAAESSQNFKWDITLYLNLTALLFCYFASTWGLLVPSSSIPFILQAYPEGASRAAWIAAAATIPNCVIQAFAGELSDILGRKIFLLGGMVLGLVGTIVSSRGDGVEMIIGGQVLNGCGLTLGYLAIPMVAEIVPKDKRPILQAVAGGVAGLAILIGPIIQGLFIKNDVGGVQEGWRAGFYVAAGFYALTFVLVFFFYHPAPRPVEEDTSMLSKVLHLDWTGVFMVASGLVLFLVGLEFGGNPYSWASAIVLCTLIIGGIVLVVFGIWEWKGTKVGLFHHRLFEHRNFMIAVILNVVGGIVLFGGQAYLPQEIAILFTQDAVLTGVYSIPFNFGSVLGGVIGGVLMSIFKEAKGIVITSFVFLLVGVGLMAVMEPHINVAAWFFPTLLMGTAIGAQMTCLYVIVGVCTPNMLIATAMSLVASIRALGGSIGIVIFSQIFHHEVSIKWPAQVSKALLEAGLPGSELEEFIELAASGATSQLLKLPGVTPALLGVFEVASAQAYADSFRFIWYSLIPFTALSLALAFLLQSTKSQMNSQVAAGVRRGH
ncbi:hypothetical protein AYO21_11745 [Fonsecaea monophora]|uniref:Major facilitator superfamily (MFS) profile domain-containing protein n=1 Tax=Fonsecaea monophora TaxID=254056 RepID=A0A177EQ33_9EURO|nr:hypothetical protein AYO21_11745 [Fonsecaea monophora]KAH0835384.1 hypothetical protein FOPE_03918 [Fonsecaea pedrosoi]OAG34104.1 hypothetical protein AYO21_11745 [Fonsecaea monophora]